MTQEEVFEKIFADIKKYQAENKIIKVLNGDDSPSIIPIESLCNQPIEGLLYDLDLDIATLMTLYKNDPMKFADYMAIVNVLKFLHNEYIKNKQTEN